MYKRQILYYSNVDWYWIKQRPHFIAEGLARTYNVKFVYQHRYNRSIMQKSREQSIVKKVYPIYVIPLSLIHIYVVYMDILLFLLFFIKFFKVYF